jgi:uncharacterized protein DUF1553/uncharacterized protein DUF1549/cytochrome c
MKKLCLLLATLALGFQQPPQDREGLELFEKRIRPVLIDRCYSCHSSEAKKLKGELYVDSREGLLKGGELGPSLVPGDPDKSLLIKAIRYKDEDLKMPPKGKLAPEIVADFEAWVKRGAPDPRTKGTTAAAKKEINIEAGKKYWAFQPLHPGKGSSVDEFIVAKLQAAGIQPNGAADPRQLVRRATFDLLGIPPTPEEVDAFVEDPDLDKLIDRLLARSEYGERWARHWLDIARFAESHGFEQDYDRENAYHYRDFLIQAFNRDLPYDRFVQWQIAGDEIAPQEPLAWMATGFLGAGAFPTQLTEVEFEPARYDELDSMASTTSSAFLGLSVGCARCHDHKFDPFPSRDYYRMASTFTTTIRSMAELQLDPKSDETAYKKWENELTPLELSLRKFEREDLPGRFDQWAAGRPWEKVESPAWTILDLAETKSLGGATFVPQPDGSVLATGQNPKNDKWTFKARTTLTGITALRVEALKDPSLKKGGPGRADNGNFSLTDFRVTVAGKPVKLTAGKFTHQQNGGTLSAASSVDGDKATGWAVDPQLGKDHAVVFEFAEPVGNAELVFEFEFNANSQHAIGRPRLSLTTRPRPAELAGESKPQSIVELCETMRAGTTLDGAARKRAIAAYGRIDPEAAKLRNAFDSKLAARPAPKLTKVLVTTDGMKPLKHHADDRGFPHFYKETHILGRGDVNKKQGVAPPGFLQVLTRDQEKRWIADPPPGARTPQRRTALATWMTDVDAGAGALVARVIVNRLWAHHFGRGIVATTNDFGVQGEPPSHPELLEYLAAELIRNQWRLKPIHKLMMTSAVYRQSTEIVAASATRDPDNKLFWRRDPRRLEAEAVRDSLLDVGGLLDRKMYGPGTLDEAMTRRSIYFFIKRSRLIPMMMVFDAPEPLVSQGGRPTTTIAPQALLFMNSPLVRKSAAGLAKRGGVEQIYRRALGRSATPKELAAAADFLSRQSESYKKDGKADASMVDFAQALLCLNEFVYVN